MTRTETIQFQQLTSSCIWAFIRRFWQQTCWRVWPPKCVDMKEMTDGTDFLFYLALHIPTNIASSMVNITFRVDWNENIFLKCVCIGNGICISLCVYNYFVFVIEKRIKSTDILCTNMFKYMIYIAICDKKF